MCVVYMHSKLTTQLLTLYTNHQTYSLEALHDLREELDELNEFRSQDLTALADAHLAEEEMDTDSDNEEMDYDKAIVDDVVVLEEQEGVAIAENESEVAAEMSLPIRAANENCTCSEHHPGRRRRNNLFRANSKDSPSEKHAVQPRWSSPRSAVC
jgi:hypothetical protein